MLDPTKGQRHVPESADLHLRPKTSIATKGKKINTPLPQEQPIDLMAERRKLKPVANRILSDKVPNKIPEQAKGLSPAPRVATTAQSSFTPPQSKPSPLLLPPSPSLTPVPSPLSSSPPSPSPENWAFLPEEPSSTNWAFANPLSFLRLPPSATSEPVTIHTEQIGTKETTEEALSKALTIIKERKLPGTWPTSPLFMKRVEAQTRADLEPGYLIPSHLRTLPKTEFTEWHFPELMQLQAVQGVDLSDSKIVDNWKSFYAKLCVIEAILRENNPQIHIEKLSDLFNNQKFQDVLRKGVTLFGPLSRPEGGPAREIVNIFNTTLARWDAVVTAALQGKLLEITSGSLVVDGPPLSIISQFLGGSSLLNKVAVEYRKSPTNIDSYLSTLNPDQKKDLCNSKHFKEEISYFLNNDPLSSLQLQKDTYRWKLFYAKLCVLNAMDPLYLAPLEHSILKDIVKRCRDFFNLMNDENGNALEIAATCDALFKKISAHEKKEEQEAPFSAQQLNGLEVKESKEEGMKGPTKTLSLKEKSALIAIRYPCDFESEDVWGPMRTRKTGSFLKERAVLMSQAKFSGRDLPASTLSPMDYASITKELNKNGLLELLKNHSIELTNAGHVTLLQSFYAKMCVVDDEHVPENLEILFTVDGFLPTLENTIIFFDTLAGQDPNAKHIAQVFKNVSDRYHYSQIIKDSQGSALDTNLIRKIYNKKFATTLIKIQENLKKINEHSDDNDFNLNKIKQINILLKENNSLINENMISFQKNHQTSYLLFIQNLIQQKCARSIGLPLDSFFEKQLNTDEMKKLKKDLSEQELDKNYKINFTNEDFNNYTTITEEIKAILANFQSRDKTLQNVYVKYLSMHGLLSKTGIKSNEYIGIVAEINNYCGNQMVLLKNALSVYKKSHHHETENITQLEHCFTELNIILQQFSSLNINELTEDHIHECADRLGNAFSENIFGISEFLKSKIKEQNEFIRSGGDLKTYLQNACMVGEGASAIDAVKYNLQVLGRIKSLLDELNTRIRKKELNNMNFENPLQDLGLFIEAHLKHTIPEIATKAATKESAGGKTTEPSKVSNTDKTIKEFFLFDNAIPSWEMFKTALQLYDI